MEALAPQLAANSQYDQLFASTLHSSARRGRPELLSDLRVLLPWPAGLAQRAGQPMALTALGEAIIDRALLAISATLLC